MYCAYNGVRTHEKLWYLPSEIGQEALHRHLRPRTTSGQCGRVRQGDLGGYIKQIMNVYSCVSEIPNSSKSGNVPQIRLHPILYVRKPRYQSLMYSLMEEKLGRLQKIH